MSDPLTKYFRASEDQIRHQEEAANSGDERVAALGEMRAAGMSYGQIAEVTGLSREGSAVGRAGGK